MTAGGVALRQVTVHGAADHTPDWSAPVALPSVAVAVDVKPGSHRNPVNLRSKGVIPIAILGSAGFDATRVDGSTVRVGPSEAASKHPVGHVGDINDDGYGDWLGHFPTRRVGLDRDSTSLALAGLTYDGTPITGSDAVKIVRARGRRAPALLEPSSQVTTWADLRR